MNGPPHIVQCNVFEDPHDRTPEQLLTAWPSLVDIARAAADGGCRVSVVQACARAAQLRADGIDYHFVPVAHLADCAVQLCGDVLHLHGLGASHTLQALRSAGARGALLLQDHADRVPRFWWRRRSLRTALRLADAVTFCSAPQWRPFQQARLLAPHTRLYAVPESTSHFTPGDQADARRESGLHGNPCIAWVGHLDANKDPLTMLAGVARAMRELPELQLWCHFAAAPLRAAVERAIAEQPLLRGRVHLLGRATHRDVERALRAADLYVAASHREGSGYALIEALACGATPVVSDIPSFAALTGAHAGGVGGLWRVGDADDCAAALLRAWRQRAPDQRARVRRWFESQLSSAALGRRWRSIYDDLCHARGTSGQASAEHAA